MIVRMNDTRMAVITVLKGATAPMTLAEISAAIGVEVKTGTTNALVTAGAIVKVGEATRTKSANVAVATYTLGAKTPAQLENFSLTDKRKAVLDVLAKADAPMTLAEISAACGIEIKSGTTNTMVAKDLIAKAGEKKVAKSVNVKVATYAIGDISALEAAKAAKEKTDADAKVSQ